MLKKIIDTLIDLSTSPPIVPKQKPITAEELKQVAKVLDHATLKAGSAIKYSLMDMVKPRVGSVVYCRLALNQVEHTGIYIGYNKIMHLDGDGRIRKVTPKEFLDRLGGFNSKTAKSIYVACKNGNPIYSSIAATNAKTWGGRLIDYKLFSNNCHKFTSGCVTGKRNNQDTFFSELESTLKNNYGMTEWRIWDFKG